jgi:hypothetical protein
MAISIKNIINKQFSTISNMMQNIEHANACLQQCLPSHLKSICYVGYFNKGQLTITIRDPNYASELHYLLPELRALLRQSDKIPQLTSIKYSVYK